MTRRYGRGVESEVERLAAGKYILVTTFRKDGTPVPTPVWVVRDGGRLAAWSAVDTFKVKRIRNNPEVRLAPCDLRGNPAGDEVAATAELLDDAGTKRVRKAIARRFPVTGRMVLLGSFIRRRGPGGTIGIAFTLKDQQA